MIRANLTRLFCSEHAMLLNEGELVLSTEDIVGSRDRLPGRLLRAIAGGATRFNPLAQALGADPTRMLQATQALDLVQRVEPVRSGPDSRPALYRIADNFLAFWLTVVEQHRTSIAQGSGPRWRGRWSPARSAPEAVANAAPETLVVTATDIFG